MPLPEITPGDWDAVAKSVRMMADAQNRLRARVEALEEALAGAPGASPSTGPQVPTWHPFTPSPACAMCGEDKPAGRKQLTCPACARERMAALLEPKRRIALHRETCYSCGSGFTKPSTRILCPPCSAGYARWKEETK